MVPVFVWRCQQAFLGKAVGAPADASLTPMTVATSAGTGATTPTTATVSARGAVAAGEGKQSLLNVTMADMHFFQCVSRGRWAVANHICCFYHLHQRSRGQAETKLFVFCFQVSLAISVQVQVQVPWTPLSFSLPQPESQSVSRDTL